jgi:Ca2+-binding RTX toxin-like protein
MGAMGVWRGTGSADVMVGEGEYAGLLGRAGDDILVDGGLVSAVPGYGPGNVLDAVAASGDRLATLDWVFFEGYLIVSPDPGGSRLEGGPGADILVSTGGADTLEGDGGLDITFLDRRGAAVGYALEADAAGALRGGDGLHLRGFASLLFHGGAGDDAASGTRGRDVLLGDAGADTLSGGDGADELHGGGGEDVLLGGRGGDDLLGGGGDDTLQGGAGDDLLVGGAGTDLLQGGAGSDTLAGSTGDDLLLGGAGRDEIRLGSISGKDTILGFEVGEDRIGLYAEPGLDTWEEVQAALSEARGGVALSLGGGSVAFFRGVALASLTEGDFLLG